jgi:cellobiose transport system substrate-binding protein
MQGADLYSKYMELHPNIKIEPTVAALSDDARSAFTTAIGAGSGAYDIQAVDIDWMPFIMDNADKLVDQKASLAANDYLPWKTQQATTPDGKVLGGGTDIGPEGICYRADLLDKAGIPSDRDSVAAWLGGANATWDSYFAAGAEYVQKSGGMPWFDSAAATFQGMINQVQYSWVDADNNIIASTNDATKALYDQLTTAASDGKQSAGLKEWSDDWNAAFKATDNTAFATMLCPAWIVNNIKNNAGADFKGWDIADVFPGGGGNWGGSFLVIPSQGKNIEAAKDLVAWLTAPEQQAAVFTAASNFPSSPKAEAASGVADKVEPFLNNAPIGKIFTDRAKAVSVVPYKGSAYFDIQTKMADALNRVDVDKSMTPADSYTQWLADVKALS